MQQLQPSHPSVVDECESVSISCSVARPSLERWSPIEWAFWPAPWSHQQLAKASHTHIDLKCKEGREAHQEVFSSMGPPVMQRRQGARGGNASHLRAEACTGR